MSRALQFKEYGGELTIVQVPVPEPNDNELLVKLDYSGICHSDLHTWLGDFEAVSKCPLIGGHEGAGRVVRLGRGVTKWRVGDLVGVKLINYNCLTCEYCKRGHEPLCSDIKNYGVDTDGTFQEYLTLPASDAIKIQDDTDLAAAAPILCAGVTVYKALKETNVKPGQVVVLTGAGGGLGSLGIQYARAMGMRVVALDHISKREHCLKLGAEHFVDAFNDPDVVGTVVKLTDGGPHGVINLAVAKKPMEQALDYIRKRGTVVFVALPKDGDITLKTMQLICNTITVKGSIVGSRLDTDEAMDFVRRGVVKIPIEKVRLEDVPEVYRRMKEGTMTSRAVVDFSL